MPLTYDLSKPEFNPPDCPAWAKETLPSWVRPFVGINRLPKSWHEGEGLPLAVGTRGIDRYQANQFVYYGAETAAYLYGEYTPPAVAYVKGTLPPYEKAAAQAASDCGTQKEKAQAWISRTIPACLRHPVAPVRGPMVRSDRNLDDEALLASGCAWCNEQARAFARLCQVSGIPARLVHLFGQNHTVAEFRADGRWALADATFLFTVRGKDGRLLSAAECHDGAEGQRRYAAAKTRRMQDLLALTDEALGFPDPDDAADFRRQMSALAADELATRVVGFGIVNNPLPR
jgi:hypothetical protein